jgi:hypothetical protein
VALADYSASDLGGSPARPGLDPGPAQVPPGTPSPVDLRITQFQMGGWTTTSGQRGTFAGPWVLASPASTSNGTAPPSGTINVEPAFLWDDGLGGDFGDAFGVWWRH